MDEQELLNWIPRQVYEDAQKTWAETGKHYERELKNEHRIAISAEMDRDTEIHRNKALRKLVATKERLVDHLSDEKDQHKAEIKRLKKLVNFWYAEYVNVRMMFE